MTVGSIAAALVLLAGVATTLDVPVPKPAWKSDVESALRYAQDVDRLATEQALESIQLRLYRNLSEQDQWRSQGKRVADYLLEEQATLEAKKRRLERRLRALEQ